MAERSSRAFTASIVAWCVAGGLLTAPGFVRPAEASETAEFLAGLREPAAPAAAAPAMLLSPVLGAITSPGGKANAKPHAAIDTTGDCNKCHVTGGPKNQTSNQLCTAAGCHDADIGKNLKEKTGFHGRSKLVVNGACGDCHDEHNGAGFDMINGKKDKVETLVPGQRVDATPWAIAMGAANNLDAGPRDWNHDLTGYKLIGGHRIGGGSKIDSCDDCHKPSQKRPNSQTRTWMGTDQACLNCHENYHKFPKGDRFENCLVCHTFKNWNRDFNTSGEFDHDKTSFKLNGAHERISCAECHAKGKPFAPVPHDTCETCHAGDSVHGRTFTTKNCVFCHNEVSWRQEKVATADHKTFAKFDAQGAHSRLPCGTCHKGLKTNPPKAAEDENNCTACHNNIHGEKWIANQPKGCLRCHSNTRWLPVSVANKDHKDFGKWTLLGPGDKDPTKSVHLSLECVRCHKDLTDIPAKTECIYCHVDWHTTLASVLSGDRPATKPSSRGTICSDCHVTADWKQPSFDHNKTKFPLTGKHAFVSCEQCHKNAKKPEDYRIPTDCLSCHGDPHLGKLETNCEKCHDTTDWAQEKFDHNKDSDYKLVGKHLQVDCYKCHLDLGFKGTPDRCSECHSDYHKGAWGPIECDQCHNERRWNVERGTLVFQTLHNFGEVTLTGVHEQLECETCHSPNPRWLMNGMGGECNQCHPDVHMGGRGQECHTCHSQRAWLPAEFNHASTGFPLTGTHRLVACVECHRGNVYTGTPDECAFCHADDASAVHGLCDTAFDCLRCHNTVNWGSSTAQPLCGGGP